ncbi:MAG: hypothetical protein HC827_16040 [Cyanobacteria bacterium RM1_2_2]|nr:hypothetical protein [Cyanobacteria bacterium RM1_2_2]
MSHFEHETSYREFVRRYVKTNQLSAEDYDALETYRAYLKLLPAQARRIEQEVLGVTPALEQDLSSDGHPPNSKATPLATKRSQPVRAPSNSLVGRSENSPVRSQSFAGSEDLDQSEPKVGISRSVDSKSQPSQPALTANVTAPAAMETTMIPPKPPEQYFANRQQYGQEFLQVLQSEGFNPGNETRERLRKLAIQLELSNNDVAEIEKIIMAAVCQPFPLSLQLQLQSRRRPALRRNITLICAHFLKS